MTHKSEAYAALAGGTLVLIVLGSLYTFGAMIPYISSYLYYTGDQTSTNALSILFTFAIVMLNVGMGISRLLSRFFTSRQLCIISILMTASTVFITSFMTKFVGYIFFYGLIYGLSLGIGYLPPIQNAYLHFPYRKGFCAGICMSGFGMSSVVFNYIIVALINPNDVKADHDTKRFPKEIADHLPFTLKILALIYLCTGLLGAFFVRPPSVKKEDLASLISASQEQQAPLENTVNSAETHAPVNVWQVFKRKRAYFLIIQLCCIVPFGMYVAFNYKELAFGNNPYFLEHDHQITIIGSVGIFSNGLFRSMWGYLFDKISFKTIMAVINITLLVCSCTILLAVKNYYTYLIIIPIIYMSYGGTFAITPTQAFRVLGKEVASKLFWLIFMGFSLSGILQFIIHYVFIAQMGEKGYIYCIGVFVVLEVIGLFITFFVKYQYDPEEAKYLKNVS